MEENSENTACEPDESKEVVETESEVVNKNDTEKESAENLELLSKLKDFEFTVSNLRDELTRKTDVITDLEKQKGAFEKEVTHLKRDRENAVIRYATVERQVLDSKTARDSIEKKNKELLKEIELLGGKIKGAANEKTRICGMLDTKCHELKASQKEIEKLKYDNTGLDSKLKWHLSKLKLETEAREKSDAQIEELRAEMSQLKLKEISRAKEEVEVERNMLAEKQMIEQNATLILLKHNNEEKARRIEVLEKKCHQLETDYESLKTKHDSMCKDNDKMTLDQGSLANQINDAQSLIDKQMLKIAELQSNQNDLEIIRTQLSHERESNRQLQNELSSLTQQVDEANGETERWHVREIDLLQLNKELTETVVKLKNECSMHNSKTTAVTLENELIKKDKNYYEDIISDLRKQLDDEIKKRNSDCQLMAKHISEKSKAVEVLTRKVEELSGELEAKQKKHSQSVKELTREINQLRKKSASGAEKKSPTPSTTSESSVESHNNEYPTISLEPSQKSLIDRIVRLQNEIVRQSEKIDFLENHQAQLVEELKRLRKINKK